MSVGREALIVAVDEYADPGLARLRAPRRDAEALGEVLGDTRIGDFQVRVLRNESAQSIRLAVEDFFADRRPDDLLLLHFSCHGLKNAAGELYLAAADSRPTRLASTAVAADFVNQQMADSRAQRIALFLDCCYGGAFPRGMIVRGSTEVELGPTFAAAQEAAGGRGRVVVTASSSVEYAFEGADLAPGAQVEPSVFTRSVVEGLSTGAADRDGDGWVGLNELFTFVAERVRRATPHQTPHLWAFGSEGDLLLARSRRRRVEAGSLPSELVEAARSSLPATRYGVAVELRDRLMGNALDQALAAWLLLAELAEDDSRRVSMFVAQARADAQLQISPPELDLGTWPPDAPISADVQVSGSPLALAATADSVDPWLTGEIEGAMLHVAVAPRPPGSHSGIVVVATPIGTHSLPVRVEVVAGKRVPAPRSPARDVKVRREDEPATEVTRVEPAATRVWWPVWVALFAAFATALWVYQGLDDVWQLPNSSNLGQKWYDGFDTSIGAALLLLLVTVVWPRAASITLGAAAGVGLFLASWSVTFLGTTSVRNSPNLGSHWQRLGYLGVAIVIVVLLELARRRSLAGSARWRSPGLLMALLLVAGIFVIFYAQHLNVDRASVWRHFHERVLLVPTLSTLLACLVLLTTLNGARRQVAQGAAVALIAASLMTALSLAARKDAPAAEATCIGDLILLAAFAVHRRNLRLDGAPASQVGLQRIRRHFSGRAAAAEARVKGKES